MYYLNEDGRKLWVDYAKTLGMFLIVWGHYFPEPISKFIYAVNVPLFFVLSGYLFKDCAFRDFIRKNAISLFLPYLLLCLFNFAIAFIFGWLSVDGFMRLGKTRVVAYLTGILIGSHSSVGMLWFVFILFWVKVLSYFTSKNVVVRVSVAVVFMIVAICVHRYGDLDRDFRFSQLFAIPISYLFFDFGRFLKEELVFEIINTLSKKWKTVLAFSLFVLFYFSTRGNGNAWVFCGKLGNSFWAFLIGSITGLVLILCMLNWLNLSISRFIYVSAIGSIVTMAWHGWVIKFTAPILYGMGDWMYCGVSCLLSFAIMVLFYFVIMVVRKCCPVLLGYRQTKSWIVFNESCHVFKMEKK